MKVDVTGYYTLLNDALVRRNFTLNGRDSIVYNGELSQVQAIQNAAQARVYGLQAGVEINLLKGFRLSSQFTYQKGEEELDNGTTSLDYLSINAGLENLTDQRYRPYSSGLVGPGRNLILSVRARF